MKPSRIPLARPTMETPRRLLTTSSLNLAPIPVSLRDQRRFQEEKIIGAALEKERITRKLAISDEEIKSLDDLVEWISQSPQLQKPSSSMLHSLMNAIAEKKVWGTKKDFSDRTIPVTTKSFLIHHDWFSAFSQARDFDGGTIRLPADECAFEMDIGGRRVIYCLFADDGETVGAAIFVRAINSWMDLEGAPIKSDLKPQTEYAPEDRIRPLDFALYQIRAACIALDAEVAYSEPHTFREAIEPADMEKQRASPDFSIVRLSKKYLRTTQSEPSESGPSKRLHFVRGHWRRLKTFKTWVRWHLRGDPDLGFIDKRYAL